MKKNVAKKIKLDSTEIARIAAIYEDYIAKKDIITTLFEIHKFDTDDAILNSAPFKSFYKRFTTAKQAYDTLMEEIRQTYIPVENQTSNFNFEVLFQTEEIAIYEV